MRRWSQRALSRGCALALVALVSPSCGGSSAPAAAPQAEVLGASLENPALRCGPEDSYRYVADEFRCSDGANPFTGDVEAARRSRSGAKKNPGTGHFVDSYEVPCSGGPVTVYVDMYGCEEMQRLQEQMTEGPGPVVRQLVRAYDAADYATVMSHCAGVAVAREPLDEWVWCGYLQPASMVMIGKPAEAARYLGEVCRAMPPSGPKSDARLNAVSSVLVWVARGSDGRGRPLSRSEARELLAGLSRVCEVAPSEVLLRLQALSGETA